MKLFRCSQVFNLIKEKTFRQPPKAPKGGKCKANRCWLYNIIISNIFYFWKGPIEIPEAKKKIESPRIVKEISFKSQTLDTQNNCLAFRLFWRRKKCWKFWELEWWSIKYYMYICHCDNDVGAGFHLTKEKLWREWAFASL